MTSDLKVRVSLSVNQKIHLVINFGNLSWVSDDDDDDGDDDDEDDDFDDDDDDTCRQQRSGRSIVVAAVVAHTALHKPENTQKT